MTSLVQEQLEALAFDLLTSSSIDRYERAAQRAAARSGLLDQLRTDAELDTRLLERVDALTSAVARAKERIPEEVELALFLSVLANTAVREVAPRLTRAALLTGPGARWIAALSRRLLEHHAATQLVELVFAGSSARASQYTVRGIVEPPQVLTRQVA